MVGDNVNVHAGSTYRANLKKLGVHGLHEAIAERRIFAPREGVEIIDRLFIDSVRIRDSSTDYRYLFARKKNDVFLIDVREGKFSEAEIAKIAARVLGLNQREK
jgi:hypothetical protein